MTTRPIEPVEDSSKDEDDRKHANTLMLGGLGIGTVGMIAAAVGGAVCPVCVVAAPALLCAGAFRRWRTAKRRTRCATPQNMRLR